MADEKAGAKQVRSDVQTVEAPLVMFGADADQGDGLFEQRQPGRGRAGSVSQCLSMVSRDGAGYRTREAADVLIARVVADGIVDDDGMLAVAT